MEKYIFNKIIGLLLITSCSTPLSSDNTLSSEASGEQSESIALTFVTEGDAIQETRFVAGDGREWLAHSEAEAQSLATMLDAQGLSVVSVVKHDRQTGLSQEIDLATFESEPSSGVSTGEDSQGLSLAGAGRSLPRLSVGRLLFGGGLLVVGGGIYWLATRSEGANPSSGGVTEIPVTGGIWICTPSSSRAGKNCSCVFEVGVSATNPEPRADGHSLLWCAIGEVLSSVGAPGATYAGFTCRC